MMILKTIIYIIIFVAIVLWSSGLQINFQPFSVKLTEWKMGVALVFLVISLSFYSTHYLEKGRTEMYHKFLNMVEDETLKLKADKIHKEKDQ